MLSASTAARGIDISEIPVIVVNWFVLSGYRISRKLIAVNFFCGRLADD